jgi:DNA-binding CsgD family transcriptional regulator
MTLEQVVRYAARDSDTRPGETGWASLTKAEREVAHWVETGLTNRDVARRLFISPRTVQAHLGHVFVKLGISSRRELAGLVRARSSRIIRPNGEGDSLAPLGYVLDAND